MPAIIIPAADKVSLKGKKEVVRERKCLTLCLGYHSSSNHAMQGRAFDTLGFSICDALPLLLHQPALYSLATWLRSWRNSHHLQEDLPRISVRPRVSVELFPYTPLYALSLCSYCGMMKIYVLISSLAWEQKG